MKRAKIYKPSKTAMQSGKGNSKKWILEFDTLDTEIDPLMGWESSRDTMSEVKLEFFSKICNILLNFATFYMFFFTSLHVFFTVFMYFL